MKVSFIGYGNMAKAIAKGIAHKQHWEISASSPTLTQGVDSIGVKTHQDNVSIAQHADIVFLSVKPIKISEVLIEIKDALPKHCLIVSVAAGITLSHIEQYCPTEQAIVRSMPNIATAIGKGATPLMSNEFVTKQQKQTLTELFESSGIVTWIDKEGEMDVLTALSGSGPAYVFYFLNALSNAAIKLGVKEQTAREFSLQTVIGAGLLAKESMSTFADLQQQVTSPAGTTAAAIETLKNNQFEETIFKAIEAAYQRAQELGLKN